jgi:hypothetical protein
MKISRTLALVALTLRSASAGAQGTASDSMSALTPAARYAEICPGKREAETGAIVGRVRDVDDGTALANATVTAEWLEMNLTAGSSSARHANASAKTSGGGLYLLCGVPTGVQLNLRSDRAGYIAIPSQFALDERLIGDVNFSLRRIDRDSSGASRQSAQTLAKVDVKESAVLSSLMERSGFETRRQKAQGAFVTAQDIARHSYSELSSILAGVRGVHLDYAPCDPGTRNSGTRCAIPFLMGQASIMVVKTGGRCIPNYYLDGAPFRDDFEKLSAVVVPERIKGIEVYSNVGTIPAQYDETSSNSCGSIVIWTR